MILQMWGYWCCWIWIFILPYQSIFQSKEAYFRSIGYQSDGENLEECTKNYLDQLKSYMKLYGALVQVCHDSHNFWRIHLDDTFSLSTTIFHLTEQLTVLILTDWNSKHSKLARLARIWNSLPANEYTASLLHAFFEESNAKCLVFWLIDLLRLTISTLSADGWICFV